MFTRQADCKAKEIDCTRVCHSDITAARDVALIRGARKGWAVSDSNKVHLTFNGDEFNAEGSDQLVRDLFNDWKQMLAEKKSSTPVDSLSVPRPCRLSKAIEEIKMKDGMVGAPWDIFQVDDKKKLIALLVNPTGETRNADAVLLVLYGFKRALETDEVKVTTLKKCLAISGLRPNRVDRTMNAYVPQFAFKTGRGPGSKYRLTTPGFDRADGLARSLFEQLV